jgi:Sulfotransferase family
VLEHALDVRDCSTYPDATFYDMYFSDFVADQFAVVEQIYDALGLPMTDEGAARMKAFIADNPKGKHGLHLYTPEEFGIDPPAVRRDLARYIERFDLRPE